MNLSSWSLLNGRTPYFLCNRVQPSFLPSRLYGSRTVRVRFVSQASDFLREGFDERESQGEALSHIAGNTRSALGPSLAYRSCSVSSEVSRCTVDCLRLS